MAETAADEQDLAKALDSVASAVSSLDDTTKSSDTNTNGDVSGAELPPIVPLDPPTTSSSDPEPAVSNPEPQSDFSLPVPSLPVPNDAVQSDTRDDNSAPKDDNASDSHSSVSTSPSEVTGPLADIKNDALKELRPLVDKLTVSAEEKFDTYLLLIRSTDDSTLIAPAHEAAKAITDEARRAEALLDIIKEIDYLSRQNTSSN